MNALARPSGSPISRSALSCSLFNRRRLRTGYRVPEGALQAPPTRAI